MKKINFYLILFCVSYIQASSIKNNPNDIIDCMINEINVVNENYKFQRITLQNQIKKINKELISGSPAEKKIQLLIEKDQLRDKLYDLKLRTTIDISKIRYLKGVEIIKILYEKVLSLDSHFVTVHTFSEISQMTNPNSYPEFSKVNDLLKAKNEKKAGLDLTAILGANPFVSAVGMLSNLVISNIPKEQKDVELKKIECILDFTLRMQNNLNTIYFETTNLQSSNNAIKNEIETLFTDYTKPIGYTTILKDCRQKDDWEEINTKLNLYIDKINKIENHNNTKMYFDLVFPIDKLIQFITQYNNFINSSEKFYQKFNIILKSYENEKQCESKLPPEYKKLHNEVAQAIEKFNIAYKPVEINGSKMKEILYGITEYQ